MRRLTRDKRKGRMPDDNLAVKFLGGKLETFKIRFTKGGKIVTKNPFDNYFNTMSKNHLKLLLKEWYIEQGKFCRKGADLNRFLDYFIQACVEATIEMLNDGIEPEYVNVTENNIQ